MEKIEQENSQEVQQENFIDGETPIRVAASAQLNEDAPEVEEPVEPEIVQLVPPQSAFDRAAELERQYRETVERENI